MTRTVYHPIRRRADAQLVGYLRPSSVKVEEMHRLNWQKSAPFLVKAIVVLHPEVEQTFAINQCDPS
jgi:hypothetical protein